MTMLGREPGGGLIVPPDGFLVAYRKEIIELAAVSRGGESLQILRYSIARLAVDFLSGPSPTGAFQAPSGVLVAEKEHFGSSRRARWFGG